MSISNLRDNSAGKSRSPTSVDENSKASGQCSAVECSPPQTEYQRVTDSDNVQSGKFTCLNES